MSDEPYGMIAQSFWTDPRLKRQVAAVGKALLVYYFSSPHKNLSGVYYCPLAYVSDELGLEVEEIRALLASPVIAQLVTFDPETDEVFVHGLAQRVVGEGKTLKEGDRKRASFERHVNAAHSRWLRILFQERYAEWKLDIRIPPAPAADTPSQGVSQPHDMQVEVEVEVDGEGEGDATDAKASGAPGVAADVEKPAREDHAADQTEGSSISRQEESEYLGTCRKVAWAPDKKPPEGWSEGREVSVYRQRRRKGDTHEELVRMVHGVRLLIDQGALGWASLLPAGKFTGRVLNNTHNGARDVGSQALDEYLAHLARAAPSRTDRGGVATLGSLATAAVAEIQGAVR